ncbi:hypothetical protein MATL_G00043750 [Megalops atlanticus]|uniref:Neuronal PAS domain-containing protein 1 n=1 Tax=Megalops atlanticus TaxID=7932 RepID=A0A9D3QEV0_MEGAT|nr:hypothetical protein MATL_G00043750 [Megalops atlanticus]
MAAGERAGMAVVPFVREGKCVALGWDLLNGLLVKSPTLPCLQNLRREKSRNAARSRRGKENLEFYELGRLLPLPSAITSQLDKAAIVRLTVSYLRMRHFASQEDPPWEPLLNGGPNSTSVYHHSHSLATDVFQERLGTHLLQSMDGFVFVLSQEGRFLYISETVSIYLGLSQVELTGSSVFNYTHPADHAELAEKIGIRPHLLDKAGYLSANEKTSTSASITSLPKNTESALSSKLPSNDSTADRGFFIRMKSAFTKRGQHVKSSGYKVIHVTGRVRHYPASMLSPAASCTRCPLGLVAVAHTPLPSMLSELHLQSHMFVLRVNMDLQVTYCENRISEYMDLSAEEVMGHTCYRFVHVGDLESVRRSHQDLLRKGQVVTGYYRWLQRNGGFVWIQSCAAISINHKVPDEQNITWVNYVISRTELPDVPLDLWQLTERLRAERAGTSMPPSGDPPHGLASSGTKPISYTVGRSVPGTMGRRICSRLLDSQSEKRRKRNWQQASNDNPLDVKLGLKESWEEADDSPSVSASSHSDSQGEGEGERPTEELKYEEVFQGQGIKVKGRREMDSGAVIRHIKSTAITAPSRIKTEQEPMTDDHSDHSHQDLSLLTLSRMQNGCHSPTLDSTLTLPQGAELSKGQVTPSLPLSGSPLLGEELSIPWGRGSDVELPHRLPVRQRVLHPFSLCSQRPHGQCAPSTIRYAPAEVPPPTPEGSTTGSKHSPPFPHLQRINALPLHPGLSTTSLLRMTLHVTSDPLDPAVKCKD